MAGKSKTEPAIVVAPRKTLKIDADTELAKTVKPATVPHDKIKLVPLTQPAAVEPAVAKVEPVTAADGPLTTAKPVPAELDDKQLAAREARLQTLIANETYFLPINQVEKRRNKRYVAAGAVCIVILGLAWADVALDAGILTIPGIKSPTHFFK